MKNYFVSVIIPTYNNGHFIKFALDSLFRQNYPKEKTEIIVVDDGSVDNTQEILKNYKDDLMYVYQENKGIASARNRGIAIAKGEIITFLDADDIWYEERLQKVVDTFREKQDVGMVYHPIELIDSDGHTLYKNFYKAFCYRDNLSGWVTNEIISGNIFCGGSSFAFRKEIMDKVYPIPEDIRRGIDYYLAVISSCYATVGYIPDVLGKYRLHDKNTTMLAGLQDYKELGIVNKDFAYTHQKILEQLKNLKIPNDKPIDSKTLRRFQAKESIFYDVLTGKRLDGIKRIPLLFKGNISVKDLFKGIAVSFMALFIPAFLFPKFLKMCGLLSRFKLRF